MFRMCLTKATRDLLSNKSRTILVLVAMIIGIVGVGSVLNARAILSREMDENYLRTNPASATLWVQALSDELIEKAKEIPGVKDVEGRRSLLGRVQTADGTGKEIKIFVIKDFKDIKNSSFTPEDGKWPPAKGEILIERAALDLVEAGIGDIINVKIPGYPATDLRLSGTVHAPALAPAWMEDMVYGFISLETYEAIGGKDGLNEFKFVVSEKPMDKKHIRDIAYSAKEWFEGNGILVQRIEIPKPGKHPHATQMETLLFLLEAFGFLTFVLSAIIVANMISALLSQQIRQIGMMKAVGGKNGQVMAIYLCIVLVLGLISLIVSVPLAVIAGRAYAYLCADILNFQIFSSAIPIRIMLVQTGIGLFLPLIAAMYSTVKGSSITVREALQDYGVITKKAVVGSNEKRLSKLNRLSRPFLLTVRNTFRKKGRLLFTLAVLSIGGALFITAMNVYSSMNNSALGFINSFKYDTSIRLSGSYPKAGLEGEIRKVNGVETVEIWGGTKAARIYPDGMSGNSFNVLAIPTDTKMVSPIEPERGRWLLANDTNTIVVNHMVLTLEPDLQVGDTITLKMNGKESLWKIGGIVTEIMSEPKAYVNQEYFQSAIPQNDSNQNAMVILNSNESASLESMAGSLQAELESKGYEIVVIKLLENIRAMVEGHLLLLAVMLIIMAILGIIVGGLGLSTTMSINIMERTREIGVMRAIGASNRSIFRIILGEGAILGLFSWIIAVIIALPFSSYISYTFGDIFFEAPLKSVVSLLGVVIWLGLSIIFASIASLYPAKRASEISVRDALAYE